MKVCVKSGLQDGRLAHENPLKTSFQDRNADDLET